jgi:hypothetical protein
MSKASKSIIDVMKGNVSIMRNNVPTIIHFEDLTVYTSHFFFNDNNSTPVAEAQGDTLLFYDKNIEASVDPELRALMYRRAGRNPSS